MKCTNRVIAILTLIVLIFSLCACGGVEIPPQATTDNKPMVIIEETTAVLTSEVMTSETTEVTDYDEYEPPRQPIMKIEPVTKDEAARFLFSCNLGFYYFDYIEEAEELKVFDDKMVGGSVFTVTDYEELNAFHSFLDSAGCYMTKEELYGGISPGFFETSVLVFYVANSELPSAERSYVSDLGDHYVMVNWHSGYAQIPEGRHYQIGFSCWAVSLEALHEEEFWVRSSTLNFRFYDWIESPYFMDNYELTDEQLDLAEKCFTRIDDPSLLPIPEGYKPYVDLEGNIIPGRSFGGNTTIAPFHGFITSKSDFENFLATFESVMNLSAIEYDLEEDYFEENDIMYVVGYGGAAEDYYYTVFDNRIELYVLQNAEDEFYITFFRICKGLGDYYNVNLNFCE